MKRKLAVAIATFGGSGLFPIASGTVGSAVFVAIYFLALRLGLAGWALVASQLAGAIVLFVAGVWACGETEAIYGKDGGEMVVDEALGMLLTLTLVTPTIPALVMGFFLFRGFDIVKPFPAGRCEKLPKGWGVMMDDVVAGIYANASLRLFLFAWDNLPGRV